MSFYQSMTSSGGSYMKVGNKKPKTMRYLSSRQATGSGKKVKERGLDFLEKDGKLQYFRRYPKTKKKKKSKNKKKKGNTNRRTRRNRSRKKRGGMEGGDAGGHMSDQPEVSDPIAEGTPPPRAWNLVGAPGNTQRKVKTIPARSNWEWEPDSQATTEGIIKLKQLYDDGRSADAEELAQQLYDTCVKEATDAEELERCEKFKAFVEVAKQYLKKLKTDHDLFQEGLEEIKQAGGTKQWLVDLWAAATEEGKRYSEAEDRRLEKVLEKNAGKKKKKCKSCCGGRPQGVRRRTNRRTGRNRSRTSYSSL